MSLHDQTGEVILNEESVSSTLIEKEMLKTNYSKNYEGIICSNERNRKIFKQKARHQFDNCTLLSNVVENDKLSKQSKISYQLPYVNNKLQKPLHNVCISISSSSDEDEVLSPTPKFTSQASQCADEADRKTCTLQSRHASDNFNIDLPLKRCEPLSLHVELPDLDCCFQLVQENNDLDKLCEIQHCELTKSNKIERAMKTTLKDSKNNTKSKPALKNIHINIDHAVARLQDVESLWVSLKNMEISYSLNDNAIKYSILWERENIDCKISENGKITEFNKRSLEDHVLIIFPSSNFIEMVQDFKWHFDSGNGINALLKSANQHKEQFPDKSITYVVIGADKYFRKKRIKENQKYKLLAYGNINEFATEESLLISFNDVEEAIVCLQIHEDITCHMVDTMKDLAALIISFSKGIAEAPYKKETQQNIFSWYAEGDSCKGVKVSSAGESLLQLWEQQIEQFPLVSKEVAAAIASHYPSPQLLIQAYKKCSTTQEAAKLLKDIIIRRGVGPLATTRHVGPELSRKIFHFFTDDDETILI